MHVEQKAPSHHCLGGLKLIFISVYKVWLKWQLVFVYLKDPHKMLSVAALHTTDCTTYAKQSVFYVALPTCLADGD